MQKIRKPLAKFLVFALVLSMFAGFGPAALNALAAEFLSNAVPSQVYLNVYIRQSVTGDAYRGWTISADTHYTGTATKLGETYYIDGAAAYSGSWRNANGSAYRGWFSSTDLSRWTLLTALPANVMSEGTSVDVRIPLDYRIVMTGGRTVTRGGQSSVITTAGLFNTVPREPAWEITNVDHTVAAGENLASIARRYGVTVDAIRAANQEYFANLAARNAAQGTNIPLERGVTLTIQTRKSNGVNYTVRPGDTLWGIAWNYYGTMSDAKVIEIRNANKAKFDRTRGILEAGATIHLPGNGIRNPITTTHLEQAVGIYRVRLDETLADIAIRYYGSTAYVSKIYEANKERITRVGSSYMIYEQQWLVITR
jgi:LysM repeat protein